MALNAVPQISYQTTYTALVTADSKENLFQWWKDNLDHQDAFTQLVAERIQDTPNACIIRVRLELQNERITIQRVLAEAGIELEIPD